MPNIRTPGAGHVSAGDHRPGFGVAFGIATSMPQRGDRTVQIMTYIALDDLHWIGPSR